MKAFTNIEQSKKLAEILPADSADMWWNGSKDYPKFFKTYHEYYSISIPPIPTWSFAALLEIIRNNGRYELQMYEGGYYFEANGFITESYFNAIDACVELILKLHEQKLL